MRKKTCKTGALISIHVDEPWIRANKRFNANGDPVPKEESELWEIYSLLKSQFQVKELQILSQEVSIDYLSMRVSMDQNLNIRIDNDDKVTKLLASTGMADCNPVKVPLTKHNVQDMYDGKVAEDWDDEAGKKVQMSETGSFNWLACTTHPNIAAATSIMAGWNKAPIKACEAARKRILRFLKGTLGQGLVSERGNKSDVHFTVDADWAGLHATTGETRSRIGITAFYNGMIVAWRSFLTTATALSSGEAELYALSELLTLARHMSFCARDLQISFPGVLTLNTDASAAMGFCTLEGAPSRMKHIDIRQAWVAELRDRGICTIARLPGKDNPADFMTKLFSAPEFQRLESMFVNRG